MINVDLLRKVVEQIETDPTSWDQEAWINDTGCKTTFCIAGWTCVLAGMVSPEGKLTDDGFEYIRDQYCNGVLSGYSWGRLVPWPRMARDLLGLSDDQANLIFLSNFRRSEELRYELWEIFGADLLGPRPDAVVAA